MSMNTPPWRVTPGDAGAPGMPEAAPPSYYDGNDGSSVVAAAALVAGTILVLVGALVLGLSVDFGEGSDDAWKVKAKLIGMSGFPSGFGIGAMGGSLLVGVALLGALGLARAARGSNHSGMVPAVTIAAGAAAGYLALVTVLNIVVDFTFLADTDDDGFGAIAAALLGDAGSLVVLGSALWWSMAQQRR